MWDLASTATLQGSDIYTHHPAYPGGPYAYFPLFLYLELPLQFLAAHTGISFTVLGKVPILAGDVACALVLAAELRDRTASNRAVLLGTSLFFLNPLVLYNGAFYGRFDTVALALLLFSVRLLRKRKRSAGLWYGLAVAAKTFPAFVLPGIVRYARGRRIWIAITPMTVLLVLSAPYLPSWRAMLSDIVVYDAVKAPGALSWQTLLLGTTSIEALRLISHVLLAVYLIGTVLLARVLRPRPVHPRHARPVSGVHQCAVGAIPALADAVAGARSLHSAAHPRGDNRILRRRHGGRHGGQSTYPALGKISGAHRCRIRHRVRDLPRHTGGARAATRNAPAPTPYAHTSSVSRPAQSQRSG